MKKLLEELNRNPNLSNVYFDLKKNDKVRIRTVVFNQGKKVPKAIVCPINPELSLADNKKILSEVGLALREKARQELEDILAGKTMTVREYFYTNYVRLAPIKYAEKTFAFYMRTIEKLFLEEFGDVELGKITHEMMQNMVYILAEKENENADPEDPRTLKAQTIKRYMTAFRSLIDLAVEECIIDSNPCGTGLKYPKMFLPQIICLNEEEYNAVINYLQKKVYCKGMVLTRDDIMLALGIQSGIRRGEMVALRWRDIENLECRNRSQVVMSINHSATKPTGKPQVIGPTKTPCSVRRFAIPELLADVLLKWKEDLISRGEVVTPDTFILTDGDGSMVSLYSPTDRFKPFIATIIHDKTNIDEIHLHSLRHTFASMLLAAEVPITDVKKILGHKDIATTMIYADAFSVADGKVMSKVNKYNDRIIEDESNED